MPTNVKIDKIPENVQKSMNTTKNTNWAEKPPKYKSTNVSTSKNVKFGIDKLLENRVENVSNFDVDRFRTVTFKPSFGKSVEEARSDPIMKKESGSHQIGNKNQKRKRLEENFEDSPRMKKFGNGGGGDYW